ncbi:hypothetical protein KUCAC02_006758 [Chaenocephalus aceratus]|uniref:Uncharacterized protein n=1 Tax=Chaenocephalus aceratus TaxID=36190 RepID=A0ACB9VTC7_CHAAC|nr:hypothetical protein KUCAC02_006758 [Chaenocephalus aceratus]
MKGLKAPILRRKLQFSRTVRLYCSFVTKELLLNNPKFLFEGSQGNVLYTGDFRFASGDVSRIEHLHSGTRVKDIQSIYLDSTFYDPRFFQIPSREVCLDGISELVRNWISQSAYHVVWLNCKAAYGYEYLFTNLGEEFNTQIHVNSLEMFKKMPELLSYVTTDRRTQIHACRHPKVPPNLKDFLSYLQPVNIYPSVIPLGRTLTEVTQMLMLMCRNQSDQAATVYKPLGALKRCMVKRPTYDSDSHEKLFDGLDLAPVRKKMALNQEIKNVKALQEAAPPVSAEESFPLTVTDTQSVSRNYADCTESNGEEEDEEEEEEDNKEKEDNNLCQGEVEKTIEEAEKIEVAGSSHPPKWEDFFTTETLPDSQNSLSSQLQSCCSVPSPSPSKMTGSQTPELFSEEEEAPDDYENLSLTLSASLSNHSSQNQDTLIRRPEQHEDCRINTQEKESKAELSESQASSDFDIPCTPESKTPHPDELSQLYRKLASGEEVVIRKGSQGSM